MSLADRLLDASVVLSFDRSGYERHARSFDPAPLALDGRRCLVTGGNSGIGFAAAEGMAAEGAHVWLLCRDLGRGEEAAAAIRKRTGNPHIGVEALDVASAASVDAFARRFAPDRIDVLVHNAGVLPAERILSPEGHELTFATHVAGPLRLVEQLRPRLGAAQGARVIFVSSGGMYTQRLSIGDVDWTRRRYDGVVAYAQTKRMQVVLAELLGEQLAPDGIVCHAMHPGWADTPSVRSALPRFFRLMRGRLRAPRQGADTVVWLAGAEAPGRCTGGFWFDRRRVSPYWLPGTREGSLARRAFFEKARAAASREATS